jgi:hypothetical protein
MSALNIDQAFKHILNEIYRNTVSGKLDNHSNVNKANQNQSTDPQDSDNENHDLSRQKSRRDNG